MCSRRPSETAAARFCLRECIGLCFRAMRSYLLLAGLICATAAFATTYKWTDRNGVVHYSDRPAPGAEVIHVPGAQGFPALRSQPTTTAQGSSSAGQQQSPYLKLDLWKPENDETFTNTGNQVTVRLRLEPDLQPGHTVWLYLDGKRVDGLPAAGETFTLNEVWRGSHTLSAMVADSKGTPLIRSPTVTFHMQQTSVRRPVG